MTFLKIITFPIRLVLSLSFNIISIVLVGINASVIQFVKIAALLLTGAASVILGIAAVGLIIAVTVAGLDIKTALITVAILSITYLFCMFVPIASEAIENFLFFAANKSKSLAEFFMTGRKYSSRMLEEIEILDFDDLGESVRHDDFVQPEERKYSLSELQELSKIIGQMNQFANSEAVINPEPQTENQSVPLIEVSEISDNSNDNDEFFEIPDIEFF